MMWKEQVALQSCLAFYCLNVEKVATTLFGKLIHKVHPVNCDHFVTKWALVVDYGVPNFIAPFKQFQSHLLQYNKVNVTRMCRDVS